MIRMRAISIRQPWAEEILIGDKKFEYRKTVCRILNEPVYIYASPKVEKKERERFEELGLKPGDLPTKVLVGTIEFESCSGSDRNYKWKIKNPKRLNRYRKPAGKPQPIWFYP
jgi:hypothetical protein